MRPFSVYAVLMTPAAPPSTRWLVSARNRAAESTLERELGVSSLLAALLVQRGLTEPAEADTFLNPKLGDLHDPRLLPDYEAARDRIMAAREAKELIYVHGDYDVDGVTSAALLARFLGKIGCRVSAHVPHRMKEGYGIHLSAVDQAHEEGAKLFLTCDCGGSAVAQVEHARSYGMRVVVTDHHTLGATLPAADALVNPHRADSVYPFPELSGVGVAFKLCDGLTQELGMERSQFHRAYLDLAALGTIADVMPLVGENRIIARYGLEQLGETKKIGLQQLKREAKVEGKVSSYHVGYILGPRLNAAGRVDDAALALQLLMSTDAIEAAQLARQIEDINTARRAEQQRIIEEAVEQVVADGSHEKHVIVVAKEGWHAGVVGIVAGRLVEQFRRPTFVLTIDPETRTHKGSARSIPKFHLADAIRANGSLFSSGGGHAMAAGCSFDEENLDAVVDALNAYAAERLTPEDFAVTRIADIEVEPEEVTEDSIKDLLRMEPFGAGNDEPMFIARAMEFVDTRGTKNPMVAQMTMRKGASAAIPGVIFSIGEQLLKEPPGMTADVLFYPSIDEFRGRTTVKWKVKDYVPLS